MNDKKFQEIVESLKKLRVTPGNPLNFDDNMLLDCATRIYNSESINSPKEIGGRGNTIEKATKKQIDWLAQHDVNHNAETLTKKEAHELISKHKNDFY